MKLAMPCVRIHFEADPSWIGGWGCEPRACTGVANFRLAAGCRGPETNTDLDNTAIWKRSQIFILECGMPAVLLLRDCIFRRDSKAHSCCSFSCCSNSRGCSCGG